jgi:alkylation response protein AidB-like acyl-CoA dehydrogenase
VDFDSDPADEAFRFDVRQFLAKAVTELAGYTDSWDGARFFDPRIEDRPIIRKWTRALDSRGLLVPHWPRAEGGASWSPGWRRIVEEELFRARCPPTDNVGTHFAGPILCAFGSPAQKRRYLPAIRSGEHFWCQGFSEPQAGSDVMSLQATARPEKDTYVVNGHKLWTSLAHLSDMMFALVRIDMPGTRRQPGLSFLLIDMNSPGITVRPVMMIDGVRRVNEVLLDNVVVPQSNLVGEAGKGWVYARQLLANERAVMAGLGGIRFLLQGLRSLAAADPVRDHLSDPVLVNQLSRFEAELEALEYMELRLLYSPKDDASASILGTVLKLRGCELRQHITSLTLKVVGERGLELPFSSGSVDDSLLPPPHPSVTDAVVLHLFQRSATLAGGTSEIQRNLIAALALGL